jgi:hypothetical protein
MIGYNIAVLHMRLIYVQLWLLNAPADHEADLLVVVRSHVHQGTLTTLMGVSTASL